MSKIRPPSNRGFRPESWGTWTSVLDSCTIRMITPFNLQQQIDVEQVTTLDKLHGSWIATLRDCLSFKFYSTHEVVWSRQCAPLLQSRKSGAKCNLGHWIGHTLTQEPVSGLQVPEFCPRKLAPIKKLSSALLPGIRAWCMLFQKQNPIFSRPTYFECDCTACSLKSVVTSYLKLVNQCRLPCLWVDYGGHLNPTHWTIPMYKVYTVSDHSLRWLNRKIKKHLTDYSVFLRMSVFFK